MFLTIGKIAPCCDEQRCYNKMNGSFHETMKDNIVCDTYFEKNGFRNIPECVDSVKLFYIYQEDVDVHSLKIGDNYEYLLKDNHQNEFIVRIEEVNVIQCYIKINKIYKQDFDELCLGKAEIKCILDYNLIPGITKLRKMGYSTFPSFHESHIDIIKNNITDLHVKISGGFHPLITDLTIIGIYKQEVNMDNKILPLDYFTKEGNIGNVAFQTNEDGFIVKLTDNYSEGFNEETVVERINEYYIYCHDIHLDFIVPISHGT